MENFLIDPNKIVTCNRFMGCGWSGKISECEEHWVYTSPSSWAVLAGREGYTYHCPKCNKVIYELWTKMS